MMRSLRMRLILGTAAATTVSILAAAGAIYLLFRASLRTEFDAAMLVQARAIAAVTEFDGTDVLVELDSAQLGEFGPRQRPEYFMIWDQDDRVVAQSTSLDPKAGGMTPPVGSPDAFISSLVQLPDGRPGRQITIRFMPRIDEEHQGAIVSPLRLAVAKESSGMDQALARLRWLLFWTFGGATVGVPLVAAWLIQRGLLPVNRLADDIERIGARNLSERLNPADIPRELTPVVLRLNDLLGRLQSAFNRETAFTADAAHELRTPLAGLEAALEVCADRPREPQAYKRVVLDCLKVVRGMNAMVENLLLLARADADQIPVTNSVVHVGLLLPELWEPFAGTASQKALQIEWDVETDLVVFTDRQKLSQIISNLFDNAVRYADSDGRIAICAQKAGEQIRITIVNSGSRVHADQMDKVFLRFWRGDPSRHANTNHCGLGLSVCRKLVTALRGSIVVKSAFGGDFTVRFDLPIGAGPPNGKFVHDEANIEET